MTDEEEKARGGLVDDLKYWDAESRWKPAILASDRELTALRARCERLEKVAEAARKYFDSSLCCCDTEASDDHRCGEDELRTALDALKEGKG